MSIRNLAFAILAFAFSSVATAADVRIALPGGGAIMLDVPADWVGHELEGAKVRTLELRPKKGAAFAIHVSPLVLPDGAVGPSSPEELRKLVQSQADDAKSQAEEAEMPVRELKSDAVQGYYFSATDKSATQTGDDFKYMTMGCLVVGGMPVGFTILGNGEHDTITPLALAMLQKLRRE